MLSVIIPTHCRADLLRNCLASVCRHAPPGAEILVVDDASPDQVASRTAGAFPGVRVVRRETRGGFCAAANAGVRHATFPIVELLNDDAEATAGWAEGALAVFRRRTAVVAVAPLVLAGPAGERIDSAGDRYYLGGVAGKRGHGQAPAGAYLRPGPVFGASGCGAFYRRDAFLAVGGFPEEFEAYFDDVDLAFRLRRAGGEVWYEPGSRVLHHGGASYGRPAGRVLAMQSRNEERVYWRNLPPGHLVRGLPRHLAVLAGKALRRWREGQLGPWLRGRLAVLAEAPAIAAHRRRLAVTTAAAVAWGVEETWWGS
jgi:GT2 family glycosyltransferase